MEPAITRNSLTPQEWRPACRHRTLEASSNRVSRASGEEGWKYSFL